MMVEGDSGMMGGSVSHEYMAPSEAGEDEIVFCRACGYAANVELAVAGEGARGRRTSTFRPTGEIETPDVQTIEQVAAFLALPARAFISRSSS